MIRRHPLIGSAGSKYGLVYTDNNAIFLERQTANGAITDSKKLKIKIKELKGKSQVWNQFFKNTNTSVFRATKIVTDTGLILTPNNTGISTGIMGYYIKTFPTNHKIYISANYSSNTEGLKLFNEISIGSIPSTISAIRTANSSGALEVYAYGTMTAETHVTEENIKVIDLTLLGIDNLTTVEEVEAWLANNIGDFPYYAYNPGTILNSKFNTFESVEFNQWDEEWETGGISSSTGQKVNNNLSIRTKNLISVFTNTTYYLQIPLKNIWLHGYDINGNWIGVIKSGSGVSETFKTPNNCTYLMFQMGYSGNPLTTYNHDICINLSNPIHNGQYKPYKSHIINLNLTTLTGKVNGEGQSVVICPDGLKSVDTTYDEGIIENGYLTKIIKRIDVVDMGTLDWFWNATYNVFKGTGNNLRTKLSFKAICSKYTYGGYYSRISNKQIGFIYKYQISLKDSSFESSTEGAAALKTSLSGVMMNYELIEPIIYVLDNPIYVGTFGHSYGVERILPQNTEEPYTTPANMVIDYFG